MDSQFGEWCTTDIEVKIRNHDDSDLEGQNGFIRTVNSGACSVFLPAEDRVVTVLSNNLEPAVPGPGDRFKVIFGEERESVGEFVSMSGSKEALVSINGSKKMMPINYLCKVKMD